MTPVPGEDFARSALATRIAAEDPDGGRIALLNVVITWRDAGAAQRLPETKAAELVGVEPEEFVDVLAWALRPVPAGPPSLTRDAEGRLTAPQTSNARSVGKRRLL